MIKRNISLGQLPSYHFEPDYPIDKLLFFDIETTGFSAETSYLYLIGCGYYDESSFHLIQWFSEGIQEEAMLITSFYHFLNDYKLLIHFNGSGFDLPYLQKKCRQLGLDYDFATIASLDIYKQILPYKKILSLKSLKLKAIEGFLQINRKDTFSGGELISVYQSYLGLKHLETLKQSHSPANTSMIASQADELLGQLLLHNEDDIRGLLYISSILSYTDLFEKPIRILKAGIEENMLNICFELSTKLPVAFDTVKEGLYLSACDNTATLSVPVYEGELKHFYENYRDYYYLPAEDYAVHKSLACYVDKDFREKAKPSNCYIKKQGIFAPQYEALITPYFKNNYNDKLSFLEIHTEGLLREDNLNQYVVHIMEHMRTN